MTKTEEALKTLASKQDDQTQQLVDKLLASVDKASSPTQAAKAISTATTITAALAQARKPASPQFFERSVTQASQLTSNVNPVISEGAYELQTELASYRSSLTVLQDAPRVPTVILHTYVEIYTGSSWVGGAVNASQLAIDPFRAARKDGKLRPLPLVDGTLIENGRQTLDGFDWKGVTFLNTEVIYNGGPVELNHVRFVNCRFAFSRNPLGGRVANYIALSETSLTLDAMPS